MKNKETKINEDTAVIPGTDNEGRHIFTLLVKRTYSIKDNTLIRSNIATPLLKTDVFYLPKTPHLSTVKYESDLVPYKVKTDIVVIGKAYAPEQKETERVDIVLIVGDISKKLCVFGDRTCEYVPGSLPVFKDPKKFTEMELCYERAYGGKTTIPYQNNKKNEDEVPDLEFNYPRNFLGKGLILNNEKELVENLELPNIENPSDLLTPENMFLEYLSKWNHLPLPQGIGWFPKNCFPRSAFTGYVPAHVSPDETMKEESSSWKLPKNHVRLARQYKLPSYDIRYANGASQDLFVPYLKGNEPFFISNMTREGDISFNLTNNFPRLMMDIGFGENELETRLHTVLIQPDERKVDLVWAGSHQYPGIDWLPEMKKMNAEVIS